MVMRLEFLSIFLCICDFQSLIKSWEKQKKKIHVRWMKNYLFLPPKGLPMNIVQDLNIFNEL